MYIIMFCCVFSLLCVSIYHGCVAICFCVLFKRDQLCSMTNPTFPFTLILWSCFNHSDMTGELKHFRPQHFCNHIKKDLTLNSSAQMTFGGS